MKKNNTLYAHPFSKAYWRDAALELKDTKMLVIAALMIALRVALKGVYIPLGPQLNISPAILANALGAMIYGPVVAIPAAIVSDTLGCILFPMGDYFLPFVLTEIVGSVIFALLLYRAKLSATRVVIARFAICLLVNVLLQTFLFSWQYAWMGNPEKAKSYILGAFTTIRIFKNLYMFPIESVVITLLLKVLTPIARRARLIYDTEAKLRFTGKQIAVLVLLFAIGAGSTIGYLNMRYSETSRSLDYTDSQRVEENKAAAEVVDANWEHTWGENIVCIVDSAYCPLFGKTTDYTVSVYTVNLSALEAGHQKDKTYTMETLWGYSKSMPGKDIYGTLSKVATVTYTQTNASGEVEGFQVKIAAKN